MPMRKAIGGMYMEKNVIAAVENIAVIKKNRMDIPTMKVVMRKKWN